MSDSSAKYNIYGLHHVQLAIPKGSEAMAREFYCELLGFDVIDKPAALAGRGGLWLRSGSCILHLGVEEEFQPARKAHPALLASDLPALAGTLAANGVQLRTDVPFEGMDRLHAYDPFGNRLELVQLHSAANLQANAEYTD